MKTVITQHKQTLTLEDKPLGTGGSGAVYRIKSPQSMAKMCVKIYKSEYRTPAVAKKLAYQVKNPPSDIMGLKEFVLCWPTELVADTNNKFVGFVMPLAFADSISLKMLSTAKIPNAAPDAIKQQFGRTGNIHGGLHRLNLCINLAHAVHKLHAAGYVVIDLKPENFMVTPDGGISVLDLDNVQVSDKNGKLLFNAELATIDYQPAEGLNGTLKPQNDQIPASWDYFSLALIFYQILYGIHPYRASFKGPYADIQSEHQAIKEGLYVHGSKSRFVNGKDEAHNKLLKTPRPLQMLFMRAFDVGHQNPERRPNAKDFGKIFYETHNYLKKNLTKPNNNPSNNNGSSSNADTDTTLNPKNPPPPLPPSIAIKLPQPQPPKKPPSSTGNPPKKGSSNRVTFPKSGSNPPKSSGSNGWAWAFWILFIITLFIIIIFANIIAQQNRGQYTYESPSESYDSNNDSIYTNQVAADAAMAAAEATAPTENSYNIDTSDRTHYAPNGMHYPDGAGHVEGYPKLNQEGYSMVTILNDKNDFGIFGKLLHLTADSETAVRTFYIPPYGGLNLRDLNAGSYQLRFEKINQGEFLGTNHFVLEEYYDTNGQIQGSHLTTALYGNDSTAFMEPIDEEMF